VLLLLLRGREPGRWLEAGQLRRASVRLLPPLPLLLRARARCAPPG
jgi:hypothetical protein